MRILACSDFQLGASPQLADNRLADQEEVLQNIADLAYERDVDAVLMLGDVFEKRHPDEECRLVFKRWLARLNEDTDRSTRVIVLAGNHDMSNTALASAVDLYDRCEFIRTPRVLDLGGCSLACLPWAPIHSLVAGRESAERSGANAQAAEALVAIARDLRGQCPAGKPALLAAHWMVSGASLPLGIELGEPVIPGEELMRQEWALLAAGHLHVAGFFRPTQMYCGSPYPCSFGEPGEHGCWVIDSDQPWQAEFVPLESRRLVTLDAADDLNILTEIICRDYYNLGEIAGATVRVRYRATEDDHRRLDIAALKRQILAAGAHKVFSVEPTIIRADRGRAVVDETMTEQEALNAWCDANQIEQAKREGLQALLQRYSA